MHTRAFLVSAAGLLAVHSVALAGLPIPMVIDATDDLCNEVVVTWNATPGAIGYKVYEGPPMAFHGGCFGQGVFVGETTDTFFSIPQTTSFERCYSVRAVYDRGISDISEIVPGKSAPLVILDLKTIGAGACEGGSATFTAVAGFYDTIEWFKDGVLVASDTQSLTLDNLSLADDGSLITVVGTNVCGSVTGGPAVLSVAPASVLSPMEVTGAQRSVFASASQSPCGGTEPGSTIGDEIFAACLEPFDVVLEVPNGDGPADPKGVASQQSIITGTQLQASGFTDGIGGSACTMSSDIFKSNSKFSVEFTITRKVDYAIAGSLIAGCDFGCFLGPTSSVTLTDENDVVVFSESVGGTSHAPFEATFDNKGVLAPGNYTLAAISTNSGASSLPTGEMVAPAAFDFTFSLVFEAGDLNGDGAVDGADLGILLANWGGAASFPAADLNDDGAIDGADLGVLLANWTP